MGNRRSILIAVVTAVAMAASGGASADALSGGSVDDTQTGQSEMAVLLARSLATLEAPSQLVAAAEEEDLERAWPYVREIGDLDGDGLTDVLSTAYTKGETSDDRELVLVGHRGLDGTVLFTHRRPELAWDTIVPARVGAGSAGLLLIRYQGTSLIGPDQPRGEDPHGISNYGVNVQLEIVAIDGAGDVVWERTFAAGHYAYTSGEFVQDAPAEVAVARDVAVVSGLLEGPGATDLLIGVYDRTTAPTGRDASLRAIVVDGADGTDRSAATLDISDALTALAPADDVTGDGRQDYTVLVETQGEDTTSTLRGYGASDGMPLWAAEVSPREALFTFSRLVGDMTGDGTAELALTTHPWFASSNPSEGTVDVVDGAAGALLRTLDAGGVIPLGDVTGDGKVELGTWSTVATGQEAGARYAAHGVQGPPVYEAEHLVARNGNAGSVRVRQAGDVDGDGISDLVQEVPLGEGEVDARIVRGRTGSSLRQGALGGAPTRATVDGQGDDFIADVAWGRSVRDITAFDGVSGDSIWTTRLRARGSTAGAAHVSVADLDGDGRGEAILTVGSSTTEYTVSEVMSYRPEAFRDGYVLSGRDGSVLWQTDPDAPLEPAAVDGDVDPVTAFNWEGATAPGVIWGPVQPDDCSADDPTAPCERLLLRLSNPPAGGEGSRTATAAVEISDFDPAPAPVTDFDLYVFESDQYGTRGRELGRSTNWYDPHDERVTFPLVTTPSRPAQFVLVEVVAYDNPTGSGYQGTARIED